jgi:hypothetical protein
MGQSLTTSLNLGFCEGSPGLSVPDRSALAPQWRLAFRSSPDRHFVAAPEGFVIVTDGTLCQSSLNRSREVSGVRVRKPPHVIETSLVV